MNDETVKRWLKDYAGMLSNILARPLPQGFTDADMQSVRDTRDAVRKYVAGEKA